MKTEAEKIVNHLRNEAKYYRRRLPRSTGEEARASALMEAALDIEAGEHLKPHAMDEENNG